jgi:hypothetical protein
MPEHINPQQRRRSATRREEDREFTSCPKYPKHDLSREQVKEIVEEVVEKLNSPERTSDIVKEVYKQMKVDAFDEGKSAVYKVIVFIGIAVLAIYNILSNHPLK